MMKMNKELLSSLDDYITFCKESRAGKDIDCPPANYPCIIVFKEYCGWYDYEYVYLTDF